MLFAVTYVQDLDPLGNRVLSTAFAAIPVLLLFYLLVGRRWIASLAGATAAASAIVIACLAFKMPLTMASMAFVNGVGFGLLPVGWTVLCAMLVYNVTVETGQFSLIRRSIAHLSDDARIQAVLVWLRFKSFQSAVICLIANTSPVAFGRLGTPILTLSGVTSIPGERISTMA